MNTGKRLLAVGLWANVLLLLLLLEKYLSVSCILTLIEKLDVQSDGAVALGGAAFIGIL